MTLAPRLDLRQSQSLVMTPQLQQAIKLLTLSNLEVEGFLAEELEKNPLLEAGGEADGEEPEPAPVEASAPDATEVDALIVAGDAATDRPLEAESATELAPDRSMDGAAALPASEDGPDLDALAAAPPSLHDHLLAQAGERLAGGPLRIAQHLIDLIDEAGYLDGTVEEVAARLGVSMEDVATVLSVVQTFDPIGVGARGLAECLALQAREADRYDPCMQALLDNLDLLARGSLPQLRRLCRVDEEDMADMIRELRGYDPKPGLRFGGERAQPVTPDLFVRHDGAGWTVELNHATLPRVIVNRRYAAELSAHAGDRAARAWLGERLASAGWLVKALDQRARTIVRVASEIVRQQEGFFARGVAHLRPMTLKMVADAIDMHESTVSRVTSNKYLACERGLFELKYFFTSAIAAADGGDAASAEAVKSRIAALIAGEGAKILSDDTLMDLLNAEGFGIARRTVAKYREALGLGSSVQRRRRKALAG